MKKRLIGIIATFVLIVGVMFSTTACGSAKLNELEEAIIGEYDLTYAYCEQYSEIRADAYSYFIMEFKENRECVVKSSADGEVYKATATWRVYESGVVEIVTKAGCMKAFERYMFEDGTTITGTNAARINGYLVDITMTFEKRL